MNQIIDDYLMIKGIEEQFLKHCSNKIKENSTNQAVVNAIKKSEGKYFYCKKIILKAKEEQLTYHKALKQDYLLRKRKQYKNTNNHKSTFYQYLKELRKIWFFANDKKKWDPNPIVFKKALNNTTTPKTFNYKYSKQQYLYIQNFYFDKNKRWMHNKTNVWKILKENSLFSNISLTTVCNYINNDIRNMKLAQRAKVKHRLRKWNIDIGNIQLDVKVIGRKETKFRKYIYIMDAKDEQSKLYWQKVLRHQTKQELLEGLKEMIQFYEKHGITIKRVRTDNAMVFKKTNFVKTGDFNRILTNKGIDHEFIPLGQPECNGVIERQHRILDEEVICKAYKCENIEEFSLLMNDYQDYFNYERFHTYSFINENDEKYQVPIDFLRKYLPLQIAEQRKSIRKN